MLAFIGLGSNLNNPEKQMKEAIERLKNSTEVDFISCSSLYISKPFLDMPGPDYLNTVCKIETELSPIELLDLCHSIENKTTQEFYNWLSNINDTKFKIKTRVIGFSATPEKIKPLNKSKNVDFPLESNPTNPIGFETNPIGFV